MEKLKEEARRISRRKEKYYIKPAVESVVILLLDILKNITHDYNDFDSMIVDNEGHLMFISFYQEEIKPENIKYEGLKNRLYYYAERIKQCDLNLIEELRKSFGSFKEVECSFVLAENWFRMNEKTNLHSGAIRIKI